MIVAGSGEDLSQKLNVNLELEQKARLGPGYDKEAVVLDRCVPCSDVGLTWKADRDTQDRRSHRHRATRP